MAKYFHIINTIDPTRTLTLRDRFVADFRRRFRMLMADINEAVVELDVFGLAEPERRLMVNASGLQARQFAFVRDDEKVNAFVDWLAGKNEEYFLSGGTAGAISSGSISRNPSRARQSWMNSYIDAAYQQGIRRGRQELKKKGVEVDMGELGGDPIRVAFNSPIHVDRVGLAYTRAYSRLKGITSEMETTISDVLAMGMAEGRNPREMSRILNKMITGQGEGLGITDSLGRRISSKRRAEILARTEVIRAHHSANMGEYKAAGALGIEVLAEHLTAGDARVCPQCAPLNGKRYDLESAENMIPVHPQCRCVAIPYIEDDGDVVGVKEDKPRGKYEPSTMKAKYRDKYNQYADQAALFFKQAMEEHGNKLYDNSYAAMVPEVARKLRQEFDLDSTDKFTLRDLDRWQNSTYRQEPFAFKLASYEVEKGKRNLVVPDRYSRDFDEAKFIMEMKGPKVVDFYLKMRAINQVYIRDVLGIPSDGKIRLFRGTDGKTGEGHRLKIIKEQAGGKKRSLYTVDDPNLVGYTSSKIVADDFGYDAIGITIKQEFSPEDVVVHEHLFHGLSLRYEDEREYIVLGGKRSVPIEDITYRE